MKALHKINLRTVSYADCLDYFLLLEYLYLMLVPSDNGRERTMYSG
jgi:hypothetical protein